MKRHEIEEIDQALTEFAIENCSEDASGGVMFGGQQIVVGDPHSMDAGDWADFGNDIVDFIKRKFELKYYVRSATRTYVTLFRKENSDDDM